MDLKVEVGAWRCELFDVSLVHRQTWRVCYCRDRLKLDLLLPAFTGRKPKDSKAFCRVKQQQVLPAGFPPERKCSARRLRSQGLQAQSTGRSGGGGSSGGRGIGKFLDWKDVQWPA